MNTAADAEGGVSAVPLLNAVFCIECETISNSPHDECTVCGSHSLINLFRMVGGTLRSQGVQLDRDESKTARYNLELITKVREISATQFSLIIESMTRLAQAGMVVDSLRINVETIFKPEGLLRAA